jgi:hypothetical protein
MNKQEYYEYHKRTCENLTEITRKKNSDYTGVGDDPFANFTQVEKAGICSTEVGFLVRMSDKMSRINSFVQKGFLEVSDESVKDTLNDLSNYGILMAGYIESKKQAAQELPPPLPINGKNTVAQKHSLNLTPEDVAMIKKSLKALPTRPEICTNTGITPKLDTRRY